MVTVLTISGADRSGALARITAFLLRKGYSFEGHRFAGPLLEMRLKGGAVSKDRLVADFNTLGTDFQVVKVEFEGGDGSRAPSASISLKEIAAKYPDIGPLVQAYAMSFGADQRAGELLQAGKKIGAFVYSKEWSFGSPLRMPAALHRTLVPALQKFAAVEATDTDVALAASPFCHPGGEANCCEFLTGFIQGFLDAGPSTQNTQVIQTACRASGAPRCTYTIVTTRK